MKYTEAQIAKIDQEEKGINGRFYEDVNGYIYIGKGTRLFKYAKCSEVSLDVDSIPADTVCAGMVYLNEKIDSLDLTVEVDGKTSFGDIWAANTLMNC